MNTKNCVKCGKFLLSDSNDHVCENHGGTYVSASNPISGQGQTLHAHYVGGSDARERCRILYESGSKDLAFSGMLLVYMAAEAGVDAPLAALRKFAGLVRADMLSERLAQETRS